MAAIRDFFVSQSKRVSELEDAFANRLGAIDVLFFHAKLRVTDPNNRQGAKGAKNTAYLAAWRFISFSTELQRELYESLQATTSPILAAWRPHP
jgi:hypothetical protein